VGPCYSGFPCKVLLRQDPSGLDLLRGGPDVAEAQLKHGSDRRGQRSSESPGLGLQEDLGDALLGPQAGVRRAAATLAPGTHARDARDELARATDGCDAKSVTCFGLDTGRTA
jgi:hypothetical protein